MLKMLYRTKPSSKLLLKWIVQILFFLDSVLGIVAWEVQKHTKTWFEFPLTNFALIAAGVILIEIVFLIWKLRKYEYTITSEGVRYTSGVLLASEHCPEFGRIANARITQDFLERILGIYSIEIQVTGVMGVAKTTAIFEGIKDVQTPLKIIQEKIEEKEKTREIRRIKKKSRNK